MKILTVEYRELRTTHGYNNKTIGAVAQVADGQAAEVALIELQEWVNGQFGSDGQRAELKQSIDALEWERNNLERKVALVERKWKAFTDFLEKLGIERPDEIPDDLKDLPF